MAPVIRELDRFPESVRQTVVATGQHREMLQQVLEVFAIQPARNLEVMREGQTLAGMTARILEGLDAALAELKPDLLLAQGDTTTTFVASLAAFYRQIAVGHVEAGLRTDNRYDPFPEEMNRRLAGALATLHFAPTPQAVANLRAEGVPEASIHLVGNTVIDALLVVAERPHAFTDPRLQALAAGDRPLLLATAHRRENWGEPLRRISGAVRELVRAFPEVECVFQLHKNPLVADTVRAELGGEPRVTLVDPQEYVPWVALMRRSTLILTDSGGIQEEAPALGKPVLVMRETTERPEGIAAGTARLVGTDPGTIVAEAARLLRDRGAYQAMARAVNPYGDGQAARRIRQALFAHFGITG
jgi:UDP-N-acetylglucosamine 2-epimerase